MHVVIVGLGRMGAEIAQAVALSGDAITLLDTDKKKLRIVLGRLTLGLQKGVARGKLNARRVRRALRTFTLTSDLAQCASADLVIEAIPDVREEKETLLRALEDVVRPDTVLASTSNTLAVTALAADARFPERIVGLHFFNPVYIMQLVEVVRGPRTSQEAIDRAVDLMRRMDKTPVVVEDTPGLLVNRIAQAYFGEALHLLDDARLDVETVDRLLEAAGFPMGPFRLMDFIGIDTAFEITQAMYEDTFHATPYRPHPRQKRLVDAARLGKKSVHGGFYPPEK